MTVSSSGKGMRRGLSQGEMLTPSTLAHFASITFSISGLAFNLLPHERLGWEASCIPDSMLSTALRGKCWPHSYPMQFAWISSPYCLNFSEFIKPPEMKRRCGKAGKYVYGECSIYMAHYWEFKTEFCLYKKWIVCCSSVCITKIWLCQFQQNSSPQTCRFSQFHGSNSRSDIQPW